MRNGLVTVLYSKQHDEALALNKDSLQIFYDYLLKNPGKPGSEVDRRIDDARLHEQLLCFRDSRDTREANR
jgi:hypothetical protein